MASDFQNKFPPPKQTKKRRSMGVREAHLRAWKRMKLWADLVGRHACAGLPLRK